MWAPKARTTFGLIPAYCSSEGTIPNGRGVWLIEFRVLGSLDLRGPKEGEILSVLTQLKRATLLAYLTVARPRGFHTRDKIVGLFWPDLDQERARAALRQSLYTLRQALGENLIRSRGAEEVSLDWERLLCDAIAFEEAVSREEVEEALRLYRGEFLQGVFLSGCPDLEKWLDEERERLREMAAGAGWTLAHRQIRKGRLSRGGADGAAGSGAGRDGRERRKGIHPGPGHSRGPGLGHTVL